MSTSLITSTSSDYLSSLPPELLKKIFDRIDVGFKAGLSRSLLPFTRSTLYREVIIKSSKSFKLFCRTLLEDKSNTIGSQVIKLRVFINRLLPISEEELNIVAAVAMIKLLVNLHTFNAEWPILASLVLTKAVASTSLPQLSTLTLRAPFLHRSDQWNPIHFRHVKLYSSLQTFNLLAITTTDSLQRHNYSNTQFNRKLDKKIRTLDTDIENLTLTEVSDMKNFKFSDNVRYLKFNEVIEDEKKDSVEMIIRHHNLKRLSICNHLGTDDILKIFNKLTNAVELKELIFEQYYNGYRTYMFVPEMNLYPSISNFTSLTRLDLPPDQFNSTIFLYLRDPLPLKYLSFAKHSKISIDDLMSLIIPGAGKISTLKYLILNVVEGTIPSDRVAQLGPYFEEGLNDLPAVHPGWILPDWIEGAFEELDLVSLCEVGAEYGVKIGGSSVQAIKVSQAHRCDTTLARVSYRERMN